jgi:carnitine-CoA ligase
VVPRSGHKLEFDELLHFCFEHMPYFMVPRYIQIRTTLPRTPTEKVMKYVLRAEGLTSDTWDCEKAGWRITRNGLQRLAFQESGVTSPGP